MYEIIKNYRDNEQLRHSFNELAMKTFDIDFEDWYQNGYWTDRYNPHSIVIDGKVVANVSVNTTVFEIVYKKEKRFVTCVRIAFLIAFFRIAAVWQSFSP